MKLSEDAGSAEKKRQHWPKEVKEGSVTVTVYRVWRKNLKRYVYNVAYYRGGLRKLDQRGQESGAMEHARFMAELLASNKVDAVKVQQRDLDELQEARRRAGSTPLLLALDEWNAARALVGAEMIRACDAWKMRITKFERISTAEAIIRFRNAQGKVRKKEGDEKQLTKSFEAVFKHFLAPKWGFAERYIDDIKARELDSFIKEPDNDWTKSTRRKRLVTFFRWCLRKEYLPRDIITEADKTDGVKTPAPKRIVITPALLRRILILLQYGGDIEAPEKHYERRPEFVPALVLAVFCGLRSCEVHVQVWEDIDFEDGQLNVTYAKAGTAEDRAVSLPPCVVEWLKLTPESDRSGVIHPFKTEVFTLMRNHLRAAGIDLPDNTLRKSWVSYKLKTRKNMQEVSDEAGHSSSTEIKHYRNSRAKMRHAMEWFLITPQSIGSGRHVYTDHKTGAFVLNRERTEILKAERQILARHLEWLKTDAARSLSNITPEEEAQVAAEES